MTYRTIASESEWADAVTLKRERAYRHVMSTTGWSWEETDSRYRIGWGETDFHEKMLRQAVGDGDLLGWFDGAKIVGYAAVRVSPLCGEEAPLVCTTGDLLIDGALNSEAKLRIARDVLAYGAERGAAVCQFTVDAEDAPAFSDSGMKAVSVTLHSSKA